jgi:hypothetical protein
VSTPDPFPGGLLPSSYPEVSELPALRRLLGELVDMQFQDLRVLLRLPDAALAPDIGCNFTACAVMTNLISGFSIWFFHNRYARGWLEPEEQRRKQALSARRFKGFVRAYYPRQMHEPTPATIARHLYDARNVLSHNLGIDDSTWRTRQRRASRTRSIALVKPHIGLSAEDVVELETYATPPFAGATVMRSGLESRLFVPGLYWSLGRMLRAAIADEPNRCEASAERLLQAFPAPRLDE